MGGGKPQMEDITVKYKTFRKIADMLESKNMQPDDDVKFELIIGSCFPNIYKNIKEELRRQYTLGYLDGLEAQETNEIN